MLMQKGAIQGIPERLKEYVETCEKDILKKCQISSYKNRLFIPKNNG